MLKHVVLMTLKPAITDAEVAEMKAGLDRLPALIPEIRGYHCGRDGRPERACDFALVSDFDDEASMKRYQAHPDHQIVLKLVRSLCAKVASVDFTY